jgi:hypothetical protein
MTHEEVRKRAERLLKFAAANRKTSLPVTDETWAELQHLGIWAREHSGYPALLGISKPSEDRTWAKVEHGAESIISALGKEPGSEK